MNRIEDLYQQGTQEQPPASLDNLILNTAKKSCEKIQTPRKRRTWMYVLPSAAVVIMSLSVIINLQHENEARIEQPTIETIPVPKAISQKPTEPLNKNRRNMGFKDNSASPAPHDDYEDAPASTISEYKKNVQKPQKTPIKRERKKSAITHNHQPQSAPLYQENAIGAVAEDEIVQEMFVEQEADKEEIDKTEIRPQEKNKSQAKRQKISSLQTHINSLNTLIAEKKIKQAQTLLNSLKKQYPKYNFKKFELILLRMK